MGEAGGTVSLRDLGPRDLAIAAAAASSIVHAWLAAEHAAGAFLLGLSFAAAAVAAAGAAVALLQPGIRRAPALAALLFAALIVAYPLVHAVTREPVDALGVATKAIEAAGLTAAARAGGDPDAPLGPAALIAGALVGFVLLSLGHGHSA